MDHFWELSTFVAVAEEGAFNAAARRLNLTPPVVTRLVTALETRIGVRLLTRTTHRTPRDLLRITAPVLFGQLYVLPVLCEFLNVYPEVSSSTLFVDRVVDLIDEGLDVALRIGELPDSTLTATRVGTVHHCRLARISRRPRRAANAGGTRGSPDHSAGRAEQAAQWPFVGRKNQSGTADPAPVSQYSDGGNRVGHRRLGVTRTLSPTLSPTRSPTGGWWKSCATGKTANCRSTWSIMKDGSAPPKPVSSSTSPPRCCAPRPTGWRRCKKLINHPTA